MAPEWMNWEGWRWISMILTACLFFYFGWDARGTRERTRAFLYDMSRGRRILSLRRALHPFAEAAAPYQDMADLDVPAHGLGYITRRHLREARLVLDADLQLGLEEK